MTKTLNPITLRMIEEARSRIAGTILRTPLVRLNLENTPADTYLKLENLQPTGSFKVRGVNNAIAQAGPEAKARGVYTVSAGNMAQALAWEAHRRKIPCTVIVPEGAPQTKLETIQRFNAKIVKLSWDEVWKVAVEHEYPPLKAMVFIHPFADERMMAGNGTIGLEILEDLPEVENVLVPFGGGGLITGIASAIKAKKPRIQVYAVEPETAAPLAASFKSGKASEFNRVPSFVDGIGAKSVLPEVWELVKSLLQGSLVVTLAQVASAVKLLVERNRIVAEGAGAAGVAAALGGEAGSGRMVAVVSGGNIDSSKLATILRGGIP